EAIDPNFLNVVQFGNKSSIPSNHDLGSRVERSTPIGGERTPRHRSDCLSTTVDGEGFRSSDTLELICIDACSPINEIAVPGTAYLDDGVGAIASVDDIGSLTAIDCVCACQTENDL